MSTARPLPSDGLERASLPTAAVGLDGRVLAANAAFCALVGRSRAEVEHRPLAEVGVDVEQGALDPDEQLGDLPVQVRRGTGRTAVALLSWRVVHDGRARPSYLHVVLFEQPDLVGWNASAHALPHSGHERTRFDHSMVAQATLDAEGHFVAVNRALGDLVGRDPQLLLGQPVHTLNHSQDRGEADTVLAHVLAGRLEAARAERVVATPDGRPVPVLADLNALRDASGRTDGVALFWHDLTRLHDAQRHQREQAEFFEALSRRANDLALVLDVDGRILYASPGVLKGLGYEAVDLLSKEEWGFVHPDDLPRARRGFTEVVAHGGSQTFTIRTRDAEGGWHWVEETVTNLLDTSVRGVVWNGRDVTERVELEQALRASESRYRAIAETGAEGIWAVDESGQTLYLNGRMAEILGRSRDELYALRVTDVLDEQEAESFRVRLRQRRHDAVVDHYELRYPHPDGRTRVLSVAATPLHREDGSLEGSLGMVTDVTEARRAEEDLRHAALHDAVTGLPNRTLLLDRLDRALTRQAGSTAVAVLDLDHFTVVNDLHGHVVGDALLAAVAQRLLDAARPTDTVARFGEDEFVVVLEGLEETEAEAAVEQLLAAVGAPLQVEGHEVQVSASAGLALSPGSADDLLREAATALQAAKRAGRARLLRYDETLADRADRPYLLAAELRAALATDALELHYQPVVELRTGRVVGMEALARWQHPERGLVPPSEFVPAAERFGLSRELDAWVLDRALRDVQDLRISGRLRDDQYLGVNLSARNLAERRLEERLVASVSAAGVSPTQVLLEITESAIMDDPLLAVSLLNRLRARGFQVAIDDFGTGYSSLAYLRDLPITVLKVDQSFVAHITHDRDALAIVASIVDLARVVGVSLVAEGVETREQAALLRRLGCQAGQGWLWSPALPVGDLAEEGTWPTAFAPVPAAPGRPARERRQVPPTTAEHGLDRLLELHQEGASLQTVASALNREGFRTPTGRRWHSTSVAQALAEAVYPSLRPPEQG